MLLKSYLSNLRKAKVTKIFSYFLQLKHSFSAINLPSFILEASHNFYILCFHFHSGQIFLNSLSISSLTFGLFNIVLFCLNILGIFYRSLLFISNVWLRKYSLYELKPFKFIVPFFIAENMVCLGKCFVYPWKQYMLLRLGGMFYTYQSGQVGWYFCSNILYPYLFSASLFYKLLREEDWKFLL